MDIETLRRQFGGDDLDFVYAGEGLIKAVIHTRAASAEVYLHGATVTHWQPVDQPQPVLFLSEHSFLKPDKPIRGGVPICWPWFGPHPTDSRQPQHGLVRARAWRLASVQTLDAARTRLKFEIEVPGASAAFTLTVGPTLQMSLKSRNEGDQPLRVEEALHTYLTVGDSQSVHITGLEGQEYIDKTAGGARRRQGAAQPVRFTGETDRIYLNSETTCVLHDPVLKRRISVHKTGSRSTVVWNPWIDKSRALSDFGDDEWTRMCCIESANAADNALMLSPKKGEHETTVQIEVDGSEASSIA